MLRRVSPDIVAILKTEDTWHFNVFDLERLTLRKYVKLWNYSRLSFYVDFYVVRPLSHLGMKIFQRWKVRDYLQCTESCLRAWLEIVESHYHGDNAYHNSTHAADVLQAAAYYLGKEQIGVSVDSLWRHDLRFDAAVFLEHLGTFGCRRCFASGCGTRFGPSWSGQFVPDQ